MALVELTAEMTHAELIATLNTNLNFVSNRFRVGDTITTSNPENPGLYFGGTWELCSVGKTIVGYDEEDEDFDTIGATGGDKTVTLNTTQIPSHHHASNANSGLYAWGGVASNKFGSGGGFESQLSGVNTSDTGGGQAHNNMPPYEVKYIWERVA
jgi:hypothetical protein